MTGKRRSWAGSAAPHQPRSALVETANHLRLVLHRYINSKATSGEVDEAMEMFTEAMTAHRKGQR